MRRWLRLLRLLGGMAGVAGVALSVSHLVLADDPPPAAPAVTLAQNDTLGTFLADANGQTVYLFTRDAPDVSNCSGGCAATWPPVPVTDAPVAPPDLTGTLGALSRSDATMQLTYNHQPLYYYSGDTQPGTTAGQGVGGVWFVVAPADPAATTTGPAPPADQTTQPPQPAPAAPAAPAPTPTVRGGYQDTKGDGYGY